MAAVSPLGLGAMPIFTDAPFVDLLTINFDFPPVASSRAERDVAANKEECTQPILLPIDPVEKISGHHQEDCNEQHGAEHSWINAKVEEQLEAQVRGAEKHRDEKSSEKRRTR